MHYLRCYELELNIFAVETSEKPGIGIGMHWLDPLFKRCRDKQ